MYSGATKLKEYMSAILIIKVKTYYKKNKTEAKINKKKEFGNN